ncbi:uncharacterized protein DUF1738 [Rhizobium sullae]|uniref:Uncharacterized protein DUF1738 n=1 Tax=Rhizobium sullae TaxID=50338 RepID=A0A4V2V7U6_RHISU|nr:uncharacterized protein DUF1738 [Rhizobium sullae]
MTTDRNHQTPTDIYERVTSQIIAAIEAGAGDYRMPWHHDGAAITTPVNVASSNAYRGVNILSLWAAAHTAGYPAGIWGTYRQWQALGAQVRKGERGHLVVFWKAIDRGEADDQDGDSDRDEPGRRMFARGYTVFNCRPGRWLHAARNAGAARGRADCAGRTVLRRPRHRHPPRRITGLLPPIYRPCADAGVCLLP